MKSKSLDTLLITMKNLKNDFINTKAYFPYMTEELIGQQTIVTAPYYINRGFNITFTFNQPLTEDHIKKNNEISGWINQSFIIRLYALLQSYHIFSDSILINHSIDGWTELDLLRRLRHVFAHSSGRYDPNNSEHNKLVEKLVTYFELENQNHNVFPIPIDNVCIPLYDGCKRYVKGKYALNNNK